MPETLGANGFMTRDGLIFDTKLQHLNELAQKKREEQYQSFAEHARALDTGSFNTVVAD